jgi:hypothetical protein
MKTLFSFEGRITAHDYRKSCSIATRVGIAAILVPLVVLALAFPGVSIFRDIGNLFPKGQSVLIFL